MSILCAKIAQAGGHGSRIEDGVRSAGPDPALKLTALRIGCLLLAAVPLFSAASDFFSFLAPKDDSLVVSQRTLRMDRKGFKVAWHPAGKVFAVLDGNLKLMEFDAATGKKLRELPTKIMGALSGGVAYTPDGKYLVGGNGVISIFDAATGQKVREILGPYVNGIVNGKYGAQGFDTLAISPDSKHVAVRYSQYEGTIKANISVFDIETGNKVWSIDDSSSPKRSSTFYANLAYTEDGTSLVSSRREQPTYAERKRTDGKEVVTTFVDFLDPRSGERISSITPVHVMEVTALGASHDSRYIATGTNTLAKESTLNPVDGTWDYIDNQDPVRLWDRATGKLVREFGPLRGAVRAISFNGNGSVMASCQTDLTAKETIWLWNVASGKLIERIRTRASAHEFFDCAFSPDGRYLAMPTLAGVELIELRQ